MSSFGFGQPIDGVMQMAFIVADIDEAMRRFGERLGVGPWFLLDHFSGADPVYRGEPSRADVALAMGFAGHMQIELIQPNDDHPSVYREVQQQRGWGFHHFGVATSTFAADIEHHAAHGWDVAFRAGVPTGGEVAYLDTHGELPGMLELIELGGGLDAAFTRMYAASLAWDGSDPVRPFKSASP